MSNRPKPTFNCQCPIFCMAVLEEKDLIAILNYECELVIRRISDKKIIYQKLVFHADKIHFIGTKLLMYDQYQFIFLDWENDAVIKKGRGFVFSNLKYYLTYQVDTFKLKSFFDEIVYWEKKRREVSSFSAKMFNDFLFLKTRSKESIEFQLWDIKHNKRINFQNLIHKEIQFSINFDYEGFKYSDKLGFIQFCNEGKDLLIEQFHDDCWRVIIFSLKSFSVSENHIIRYTEALPFAGFNRIFCFKNNIYYLYNENELRKYDLIEKELFSRKLKFKKSRFIHNLIFDEPTGTVHFFGELHEIFSEQLDTGKEFLIDFKLPFRLDESTLFHNLKMYAGSFSGGIIKVDLKTNEYKNICYASDDVHCSQVLNNKILNLSNDNFVAIWDLKTNKILRRKKIKVNKNSGLILKKMLPSFNKFRFELANYSDKSIKQSDYDEELNLISAKDLPNYEISREYSLECDDGRITIHNENKTITFCSSTTHWIVGAPEFFDSKGSTQVCQKTHNGYIYIAKDALYKINMANGNLTKGIVFRDHDRAGCMQISNQYLFLGMDGFWIFIIDLEKFELIHKISTTHESSHSLVFCPKRNFLFVASCYRSKITIYDVLTGKEVHSWQAHKSNLSKLFYLEGQNALLSVCNNGSMRKWDYTTFELLDEYYSLPAMPDKKYKKGWAHIDKHGKLSGSKHHQEYFEVS